MRDWLCQPTRLDTWCAIQNEGELGRPRGGSSDAGNKIRNRKETGIIISMKKIGYFLWEIRRRKIVLGKRFMVNQVRDLCSKELNITRKTIVKGAFHGLTETLGWFSRKTSQNARIKK